jgi:molybdopterin-guanine dinucleotide biosynthesis protein MobB
MRDLTGNSSMRKFSSSKKRRDLMLPGASPVVIGIVGASGVGKTTLICGLMRHLSAGGMHVVVVKTTHHTAPRDTGDADTDQFIASGASRAFLVAPGKLFTWDAAGRHASPAQDTGSVVASIRGAEIVIVEGAKRQGGWPRLLVHRRGVEPPVPLPPHLIALVTDDPGFTVPDIPRFDPGDIPAIAGLLSRISR